MPKLAKKPVLALGATAMLVFGAAGISTAATSARVNATTPGAHRAGGGPKQDPAALAKALGVSVTKLQAAITAARAKSTASDPATDAATQAKTLAAALDAEEATIQKVLDAQRPAKGDRPTGTTPPAGAPTGTTPPKDRPAATTPTGTTPPAGGPGRGGPGGHGGGGGRGGSLANSSALITALAKATSKSETVVKAALTELDEERAAARKAQATEFANDLAAQLGLTEAKVTAAIESSRPARPTRAAQQGTTATK